MRHGPEVAICVLYTGTERGGEELQRGISSDAGRDLGITDWCVRSSCGRPSLHSKKKGLRSHRKIDPCSGCLGCLRGTCLHCCCGAGVWGKGGDHVQRISMQICGRHAFS